MRRVIVLLLLIASALATTHPSGSIAAPEAIRTEHENRTELTPTKVLELERITPTYYVVQPGDSLWMIAELHGFKHWWAIYQANREQIPDPDRLVIGLTLLIPDISHDQPPPAEALPDPSPPSAPTPPQTRPAPPTSGSSCGLRQGSVSPVTGRPQAPGWVAYLCATAPPGLVSWEYSIVMCESGGDPSVVNRTPVWNGEHATGIAQFLPSTARNFGISLLGYPVNPYNWEQSLDLLNAMGRAGLLGSQFACA